MTKPFVAVLMGSDSDLPTMQAQLKGWFHLSRKQQIVNRRDAEALRKTKYAPISRAQSLGECPFAHGLVFSAPLRLCGSDFFPGFIRG